MPKIKWNVLNLPILRKFNAYTLSLWNWFEWFVWIRRLFYTEFEISTRFFHLSTFFYSLNICTSVVTHTFFKWINFQWAKQCPSNSMQKLTEKRCKMISQAKKSIAHVLWIGIPKSSSRFKLALCVTFGSMKCIYLCWSKSKHRCVKYTYDQRLHENSKKGDAVPCRTRKIGLCILTA